MHKTIQNLTNIKSVIKSKVLDLNQTINCPKIIAVSKSFKINHIMPLIESGHSDFGENKVQEAIEKWTHIKLKKKNINLHLVGKLQTNKVKSAIKIFDFIHSLDSEKLAKKIAEEQVKQQLKPKIFIQINIGNEEQKSGINKENLSKFFDYCKDLNLNIIGTMCLPPFNQSSSKFFSEMYLLSHKIGLKQISMGMSSDYIEAVKYNATYLRIGSKIFGPRS